MKKLICVVMTAALLMTLLASCGLGSFKCDLCGKEKFGIKYEKSMFGYSITFCGDCRKDLEKLGELLG